MPFLGRSQTIRRRNREAWQQVGLVSGFLAGRHFVGTKDLHYGYWLEGVEPIIQNLPRAQQDYCQFILKHIPSDAGRILDVGSGAGSVAAHLVARDQSVDCVSPSSFLNSQARELLGDKVRIFECDYEEYQTSQKYDCILFCESFQYVKMERALTNVAAQLRSGGKLVICDFFCRPYAYRSPIGGGHSLVEFQSIVEGQPFRLVEEIEITDRVAPTFEVIESAFTKVLKPIWDEIDRAAIETHPLVFKCINWIFGRKFAKVKKKYFTHERTSENFCKYKTYRLMRFERI
ncbi:MAG TPA: class I SAM-dependent methyltransferase [Lacipirellulaceae bacterium]|nr:class I SAM-dependent methyltransferase [Lacipirellulaceae bacterium]